MKLISRITVRRYDMGEAGDDARRSLSGKSLAVFRVLGRSPEHAMKILSAEMAKESGQVMVLSVFGSKLSENERAICTAAMEQGMRQSTKIVFCGGDPAEIFGRRDVDGSALKWYPSVPAFVSTYEIGGGRQSAQHAG